MIYAASGKAEALARQQQAQAQQQQQGPSGGSEGGARASFGFDDLLDIVNPLQHIPIVSSIYRELSGDEISGPARMAGGTLYGGPIGFVASAFDTIMAAGSGKDMGGQAMAAVFGEEEPGQASPTAVAEATSQPQRQQRAAAEETAPASAAEPVQAATATTPSGGASRVEADRAAASEESRDAPKVVTGREALLAFAQDMNGGGPAGRAPAAPAGDAAAPKPGDVPATQGSGPGSGQSLRDSDVEFMALRGSDFNHSATLRARMKAARRLMPDEARHGALRDQARPSPSANDQARADTATSPRSRTASPEPPAQPAAAAPTASGAPADLAQRMREALEKYRALHENQ